MPTFTVLQLTDSLTLPTSLLTLLRYSLRKKKNGEKSSPQCAKVPPSNGQQCFQLLIPRMWEESEKAGLHARAQVNLPFFFFFLLL